MGNHEKKNESEIKMNELDAAIVDITNSLQDDIANLEEHIDALKCQNGDLKDRVKALEDILESRFAPNTAGHPNDGGWFE